MGHNSSNQVGMIQSFEPLIIGEFAIDFCHNSSNQVGMIQSTLAILERQYGNDKGVTILLIK